MDFSEVGLVKVDDYTFNYVTAKSISKDKFLEGIMNNWIVKEDIYSLVDTFFMPYGVECDQYSILGEIVEYHQELNRMTKEEIVFMTIECNELTFDVCINKEDLFGEPAVGRRFKGTVWLQGYIEFPE